MNDEFKDREYRDYFVEDNIRNGIAFQIRAIRKRQGLSQQELAVKMDKAQNVISRLEDPDYGKLTLKTLLSLAKAFDVGLLVKFVSFSELMDSIRDVSEKALAVPSFDEEVAQKFFDRPSLIEEFSASKFANSRGQSAERISAASYRSALAPNVPEALSGMQGIALHSGLAAGGNAPRGAAWASIRMANPSNRANA